MSGNGQLVLSSSVRLITLVGGHSRRCQPVAWAVSSQPSSLASYSHAARGRTCAELPPVHQSRGYGGVGPTSGFRVAPDSVVALRASAGRTVRTPFRWAGPPVPCHTRGRDAARSRPLTPTSEQLDLRSGDQLSWFVGGSSAGRGAVTTARPVTARMTSSRSRPCCTCSRPPGCGCLAQPRATTGSPMNAPAG
jgi:hypothetical protein